MSSALPQLTKFEALGTITVLTLGLTALTGVVAPSRIPGLIAISGLLIALPLTAILGDRLPYVAPEDDDAESTATDTAIASGDTPADTEDDHAVAKLRDRYARGEIDEAEFERRLDQLLATEDLDETVDSGATAAGSADGTLELE
mgnify:CR=1 FL=1